MKYTVEIKLHPTVYRYFDNNIKKDHGVFDVCKTPWYYLISSALSRKNINTSSKTSKKFKNYIPVKVYITEYDFYHYGFELTEYVQSCINKTLLSQIINNACYEIALLHVLKGISRLSATRHYIDCNLYEDNELKTETLYTYYKRNWIKKEEEIKRYFSEILTPEIYE